jgi:hypothetical protein
MTPRDSILELAKRRGLDPADLLEEWSERAAIREYEANIPRHRAEQLAVVDVKQRMDR